MIIRDSITSTQKINFVFDNDPRCRNLNQVNFSKYNQAIIICDLNLKKSWWPVLEGIIRKQIRIAVVKFVEASEKIKGVSEYPALVEFLGEHRCSRDDLIIAIGGGTVLDAVGFLSSTYMRGIPLMLIPSTLIGQADAATAGKTCLNTSQGKNLLGTLYLADYVYNNVALLKTNSNYHRRQGMSEIFKYALLGSTKLLAMLEDYSLSSNDDLMLKILQETIAVRLSLRKIDQFASNFGHTFGHALEKESKFRVNHGDAISVGMVMALELSVDQGIIPFKLKEEIVARMIKLGLNTKVDKKINIEEIVRLMLSDKKSSGNIIRLILIQDISRPFYINDSPFYPIDPEKVTVFLTNFMKNENYVAENHWEKIKI